MEEKCLAAEERLATPKRRAEDPAVASDATELVRRHEALVAVEREVAAIYESWTECEKKRADPA